MKSNRGILTEEDIKALTRFWNQKSFRKISKKELERDSTKMQNLLSALKGRTRSEIDTIRETGDYTKLEEPEYYIRYASQRDLEHAISISPKTYNLK
ncbi:hypothetical protein BT638P1_00033 [Bacteroides phage BT638P1]|nr:hypothetical protein BT638P1_00033 [Bacteroides phage BT638P1]WAX09528.1 hypothetical protein BT638P2_00009 [Bacteroides phage BT638P2]